MLRNAHRAAGIFALGALVFFPAPGRGQPRSFEAGRYFRANCAGCHTIGGGARTGPDLKGVTTREDRTRLVGWLENPTAVIASRDPRALRMVEEAHGVVMPAPAGMTPAMAEQLLRLIDAESRLPHSQFAGVSLADRTFTPADIAAGKQLFLGQSSLRNGGSSCAGCHMVGTLGQLGGGGLGPDLTLAYVRLGGRQGLGTRLLAPPPGTMQALYKNRPIEPEEAFALVAFLGHAAERGRPASAGSILHFFVMAFAVTLVLLLGFEIIRRGRSSPGKAKR